MWRGGSELDGSAVLSGCAGCTLDGGMGEEGSAGDGGDTGPAVDGGGTDAGINIVRDEWTAA